MKQYMIALGLFVGGGLGAMLVLLIPVVILDLYLSGHSYEWHQAIVFADVDALDLIWMVMSFLMGGIISGGYLLKTVNQVE